VIFWLVVLVSFCTLLFLVIWMNRFFMILFDLMFV